MKKLLCALALLCGMWARGMQEAAPAATAPGKQNLNLTTSFFVGNDKDTVYVYGTTKEYFEDKGVRQEVSSTDIQANIRKKMLSDFVSLVSNDGDYFVIPIYIAKQSETINNLIEDFGADNPIPIPNANSEVMQQIWASFKEGRNKKNEL